jgi:bifunctional non-homologous end joining protein LigD
MRLRDDKPAEECVLPSDDEDDPPEQAAPSPGPAVRRSVRKEVPFTNLDKVFWPDAGHTKGDLIEYYRQASDWLLPYLRDRPLVLTRYPDGIDGKSFFQKNAPEWAPEPDLGLCISVNTELRENSRT